jgi:raffinose/stachyose/melibiose transport system substrate-binding protein
MNMRRVLALTLMTAMTISIVSGCNSKRCHKESNRESNRESSRERSINTIRRCKKSIEILQEKTEEVDLSEVQYDTPTYQKSTEEIAEGNKVTLKTVSMFGGTDPNVDVYDAVTKRFQEQHPNVTIEDDSASADEHWKAKVEADFSVGDEPDVLQFFTDSTVDNILATQKLVSVDEIISEYPEYGKDTMESAIQQVVNNDGVSRAIPTTGYWEGMFINEDLFERYHIEKPTDWASFAAAVEKFREAGIIPVAVSLNNVPHYWIEHLMLYSSGIEEYTSLPTSAPEGWIKGLETIELLRDMGAFPEDTDTIDENMAVQLFHDKKAAMMLDGNWRIDGFMDQEHVKVIPFPGVENQKAEEGTIISGISSGFYITKKAWDDPEKRDAAVKFVMAQTCKDSLMKYWNGNGVATCETEEVVGMTPTAESGLAFCTSAAYTVAPTDARINAQAYKQLISAIVQISIGEVEAEMILDDVLQLSEERNNAIKQRGTLVK